MRVFFILILISVLISFILHGHIDMQKLNTIYLLMMTIGMLMNFLLFMNLYRPPFILFLVTYGIYVSILVPIAHIILCIRWMKTSKPGNTIPRIHLVWSILLMIIFWSMVFHGYQITA